MGGGLVPTMDLSVFLFISRVSRYMEVAVFKFCPAGQYNLQDFQNKLLLYYCIYILVLLLTIIDIFLHMQELGKKFL